MYMQSTETSAFSEGKCVIFILESSNLRFSYILVVVDTTVTGMMSKVNGTVVGGPTVFYSMYYRGRLVYVHPIRIICHIEL